MADNEYLTKSPAELVRERKRLTDMMRSGSGADLGSIALMDKKLSEAEAKYASQIHSLRNANAESMGDPGAKYDPQADVKRGGKSGGGRKPVESIDTDELHRRALARSESGNAVAGMSAGPAPTAEDEARGMGGSVARLSDWTGGTHDPSLTPLGQAMAETPDADYGDPVYGGASRGEMVDAGLVGRGDSDAPQTWVPMYDENTRDPYNWDKRGR